MRSSDSDTRLALPHDRFGPYADTADVFVFITDDGAAVVDGEPLFPGPGQSVHGAVLDLIQRRAAGRGVPVDAWINDRPRAARFRLQVAPDGSSRVLAPPPAEPTRADAQPVPPEPQPAVPTPIEPTAPTPPPPPYTPDARALERELLRTWAELERLGLLPHAPAELAREIRRQLGRLAHEPAHESTEAPVNTPAPAVNRGVHRASTERGTPRPTLDGQLLDSLPEPHRISRPTGVDHTEERP
ncbi:hypothetical protein OK074_8820 [Actinobacteria bacterium OK074]|nr:hypothetical protein OK074_8820 [Actinobacteria bacterium OK074]